MSFDELMRENRLTLMEAFHMATVLGIYGTWRRCQDLGTKPHEPDFVAGLVLESAPLMYAALASVLPPRSVSASLCAVFCHPTPQVAFGSKPKVVCELGDILFAHVHTPEVGPPQGRALLLQAKVSHDQPYAVGNCNQLHLYTKWPDFVYTQVLKGRERVVTPKCCHPGAQYLLLDDRPPSDPHSGMLGFPGTYPAGCCEPASSLHVRCPLAAELLGLFDCTTGREFEDRKAAAPKRDWSQVVWDLLDTALQKAFNRKNSGRHASPRRWDSTPDMFDGLSFSAATSSRSCTTAAQIIGWSAASALYDPSKSGPPDNRDRRDDAEEPGPGVSVVLIETAGGRVDEARPARRPG